MFGIVSESADEPLPSTASEVFDTSSIRGVSAEAIEEIWARTLRIALGEEPVRFVAPIAVSTESCDARVSLQHSAAGLVSKAELGRDWYVSILEQPIADGAA